jgi:hypothetical protein
LSLSYLYSFFLTLSVFLNALFLSLSSPAIDSLPLSFYTPSIFLSVSHFSSFISFFLHQENCYVMLGLQDLTWHFYSGRIFDLWQIYWNNCLI